jgi:hypothetical protein
LIVEAGETFGTSCSATMSSAALRPLGLKLAATGSPFPTFLYIKEHRGSHGAPNATLFVAGLPLGMTEALLTDALSCFGAVNQIVMHPSNVGVYAPGRHVN